MAAKKKQDTQAEANVWEAKQQFCKEQIIVSERYRDHRDLVDALLEDGEKYTFEEVDSLIEKYKEGKRKWQNIQNW